MTDIKTSFGESQRLLAPSKEAVIVDGKIFYSEGHQAWNVIRLKKEVLHEYPQLRNKRESFGYKMIIPKDSETIKKVLKEISENAIPILLYLCKNEL
jgi:hypothetical protein